MSASKHFINDPNQAVLTGLRGVTLTNPSLLLDEANKIVYRNPSSLQKPQNVSVICGGGSGHEPGFCAFVGRGVLTACVSGTIFASPGAQQIRTCLSHRLPSESQGTLAVVTNYTGDVLNFGMGVEKARAMAKKVEMVVVGDDVGVGRVKSGKVGRRGLSGTALVVKICGALAEKGANLDECAKVGRLTADNLVSLGASLSRVHVPGRGIEEAKEEEERLGPGLVEIGMGIHNEPGCEKVKTDLPGLVKKMLGQMLDQDDKDRAYVKIEKSDKTLLLINNFGGVSNLELSAITTEVVTQLGGNYGLKPSRVITGTFFGSLDGPGFILSVLKLADTGLGAGKSLLELVDAPSEVTGWTASIGADTWEKDYGKFEEKAVDDEGETKEGNLKVSPTRFRKSLSNGLKDLIAAEAEITKYDTIVGDGDCGVGLKRGAEGVLDMLNQVTLGDDLMVNLGKIVQIVETTMDGTSGALYAIFLNSLASNLRAFEGSSPTPVTAETWSKALEASINGLGKYTPAQPGDRTLMDALCPFVEALKKTGDTKEAAAAAKRGAEETKGMKASLGRSVYVGGQGHQEVPDPGAHGLSVFLTGVADGL